jgi:hypothetical protein
MNKRTIPAVFMGSLTLWLFYVLSIRERSKFSYSKTTNVKWARKADYPQISQKRI